MTFHQNTSMIHCFQKCIIGSCRKKSRHPFTFDDLQLPKIDHKNQFIETQYIYQWIVNVRLFGILECIFRHSLKICLKVHDWCCWKCVSYSAGPLCVRLDLDMIYEINTKLISKALLSVFCQVFCYFCRKTQRSVRCYLLCAYYPWNLLTGEICLLVFLVSHTSVYNML